MISMDKQYVTRDGREVRIYAVDAYGVSPIHGACGVSGTRGWSICEWTHSGLNRDEALSLIEVKPKITRTYWLVHPKQANQSVVFSDHKEALRYAQGFTSGYSSLTGPHTVEFEEGSGL